MKYATFALAALLLASNGAWLYLTADQASVHKYRQQELYEGQQRVDVLMRVCDRLFGDMARPEAIRLLEELTPGEQVYEKEGHLNTTWLSLRLDESGRVQDCR